MNLPLLVIIVVAAQRLAELVHARRNTKRLLSEGAVEYGAGHYRPLVAMHAFWLVTLAGSILFSPPQIDYSLLVFFILLQVARVWVIVSLGRFWTTRIICPVNGPLVRRGPYRYLNHPNYIIVSLEIAVLPLCFGEDWIAFIFSVLNGVMISIRIHAENESFRDRLGL